MEVVTTKTRLNNVSYQQKTKSSRKRSTQNSKKLNVNLNVCSKNYELDPFNNWKKKPVFLKNIGQYFETECIHSTCTVLRLKSFSWYGEKWSSEMRS